MIRSTVAVILIFIATNIGYAQKKHNDIFALGTGIGLDYGGVGANCSYFPIEKAGAYLAIGHYYLERSIVLGLKFRYVPQKETHLFIPFATVLYGNTTVVLATNSDSRNKTFYCASYGCGIDYRRNSTSVGYWSLGVIIPTRSEKLENFRNHIESKNVEYDLYPIPITLTIGYKIII